MLFESHELTEEFKGLEVPRDVSETDLADAFEYEFEDDDDSITLSMPERPYLSGEEDDDFGFDGFDERENWTAVLKIVIGLNVVYSRERDDWENRKRYIAAVSYTCEVFGGDGLGDSDPEELFDDDEFAEAEQALRLFLKQIAAGSEQ